MKKAFIFMSALLISASIMFIAGCFGPSDNGSVCQCEECVCEDECSCCCSNCHCLQCDAQKGKT